ncbi:GDP-L-fucose synthase [Forsythia ovata]|uniref:GDP-L-fucose synthase n=1 Tax=Forsythia ovata TaxID=205694 RepID=A0ABD1V0M7_9LAMI
MDPISVEKSTPVFVAGHGGLVGSALVTKLQSLGYTNLLLRAHIPSSISPFSPLSTPSSPPTNLYMSSSPSPRLAASTPTTPTWATSLPSASKSKPMEIISNPSMLSTLRWYHMIDSS